MANGSEVMPVPGWLEFHVQLGDAAKSFDLRNREIADANGADFAVVEQRLHRSGGLFDRHQRIGPMHLIDVDVVSLQSPQRIRNLTQDAVAAGEQVEQRTVALKRVTGTGRDDEQLAGLGRIGITERRRRDIVLAVVFVLLGEFVCSGRADRAHREMHGIWLQTRGQPRFPGFAEYRLANRAVVGQHADDEIAAEQIGSAAFRLNAEGPNFRRALRTANIGDHPAADSREIGSDRAAHATQSDKADPSIYGPALAMPTINREIHAIVDVQYTPLPIRMRKFAQ
jgi:hypothetical protein